MKDTDTLIVQEFAKRHVQIMNKYNCSICKHVEDDNFLSRHVSHILIFISICIYFFRKFTFKFSCTCICYALFRMIALTIFIFMDRCMA